MERNLLRTWFEKLLDALRISPTTTPSSQADAMADRVSEPFSVVSDGLTIRGRIFFPVAKPSRLYPTLIICHGIPGSGAERPENDPGYEGLAQEFTSLGVSAVIFNFRGCGDSDGDFDMMGWTRDLEAVVGHILDTPYVDPTRLILLGFSGGGAAAIKVAAENRNIYGLAVVGTPAHFGIFEKDAKEIVSEFKERGIIRDPDFPPDIDKWIDGFVQIEPRRWIAHFEGRYLLIVHGDEDELIPVDHARELFEHAPSGEAKISIIPGGVHRLRLDPRCLDIVKKWILEILAWKS
ncbi:MAG: alpha/beta fold hydrolase [Deltaproteobacteria bacterium]